MIYELSNERVHRRGNPGGGLTYSAGGEARPSSSAASTTVHEVPDDINAMTKRAAAMHAGLG
jgi:hypothetical protein